MTVMIKIEVRAKGFRHWLYHLLWREDLVKEYEVFPDLYTIERSISTVVDREMEKFKPKKPTEVM